MGRQKWQNTIILSKIIKSFKFPLLSVKGAEGPIFFELAAAKNKKNRSALVEPTPPPPSRASNWIFL